MILMQIIFMQQFSHKIKKYAQSINFFSIAYEHQTPTCELLNNYAIALRNLRAYTECENMLLQAIDLDKIFLTHTLICQIVICHRIDTKMQLIF